MLQVRCTNCGSTAIVPEGTGEFCKCEACGSTFFVAKANAFSKVQLDHTHDVRAWREYLAKQLRLQQESNKARDYGGVKLFAQKILSVLPDDFCATYYVALAERYDDNDTAFVRFLSDAEFSAVTPDERKEVVDSLVATVEPKYLDDVKAFIARAYPDTYSSYDAALERNVKCHIQKLKLAAVGERDVFICHRTAAPDQDVADAICTRLEERGLRCWIAPRNILAGSQNYERDIIKGVENCRLFLFVSSFKSIYSEDCETELRAAVLADKVLYSYRIDDTEYDGTFKRALSQVQWLDAIDDPFAHLEQLVIDIKGMLAEDEREKAELEEKRLAAREKERRLLEEQRSREKERIERLEKIVTGGTVSASPTYNYRSRLKRAEIEVDSGNYDRAVDIIDEVLDCDPENALAWWLLLLCDYHVPNDEALVATGKDFTSNANYRNAERFADASVKRRIDDATADCNKRIVKAVTAVLDEADRYYEIEEFSTLSKTLDKCAYAFADEDGLIFERFPDVASRYYWLRLWAKYGQTPLVCVEDITREREYKTALRYASPAQKAEYSKVRSIVSKNARLFLRERSKNRANDGKLVDYLIDNKNILPVDTYNYYSSLLYYRKMLGQLNMTEAQLRNTSIDITTNEYFMLAQSMATPEQKIAYDELAATLDSNRESKNKREAQIKVQRDSEQKRDQIEITAGGIVRTVFTVLTAVAAYGLFLAAVILFADVISGIDRIFSVIRHSDGYVDFYPTTTCLFLLSAVFRIANEGCLIATPHRKNLLAMTYINIILGAVTLLLMAALCFNIGYISLAAPVFVLTFVGFAVCGISLSKNKTKNRGN